jgi:cell division transport system permease protein
MAGYVTRHLQNAVAALGVLSRQPIATTMTVAVIGVALALPASLQVLVRNFQALAGGWEDIRDFSIYLKPGTQITAAQQIAQDLVKRQEIASVELIDADRALDEFRRDAAFGEVLKILKGNPLPHTLVVRPAAKAPPESLAALERELAARAEIDLVQLDTQWLARLQALLDLARRGIWLAAALLVGAVVVIVGNTIRLDIQNRRQEIEVAKLLGATDAFVRRPFLYIGVWYGLLGGALAIAVVVVGLALLDGPLTRLLSLYGIEFGGFGLNLATAAMVFGGGLFSGWAGAWTAVARHLSSIEPSV